MTAAQSPPEAANALDNTDGIRVMLAREVARLTAENARLRHALRISPCPHAIDTDDGTAGDCVDHDHCGCVNAALSNEGAAGGGK